jgi:hypothetical protein
MQAPSPSQKLLHRRIDVVFHFEYHPLGFSKGVQGMLRTSRCFAGIFFQLGGPDALLGVERYPYQFHFADFLFASFTHIALRSLTRFFFATHALRFSAIRKLGPDLFATAKRTKLFATAERLTAHNLGGNPATQLVATG